MTCGPHGGIPLPAVQGAEPRVALPPDSERWHDIGFWLATRRDVENVKWWTDKVPRRDNRGIAAIISCVGLETKEFAFPQRVLNSMRRPFSVPVNWKGDRKQRLDDATAVALEVLNQGQSVLFHCNFSFHRAPMGILSACRYWFGVNAATFMSMLSGKRQIDPQFA